MTPDFSNGFFWGWFSIVLGLIFFRVLEYYLKKRRGDHISITGEQTEELTAWMVKWKREYPTLKIYLNGRRWDK